MRPNCARLMAIALAAIAAGSACGSQQSWLRGQAEAVSGTELRMENPAGRKVTVRLAGLAAPPPGTRCRPAIEGLDDWECGEGSRLALASAVAGETVGCGILGTGADGAREARCMVQTRDLAEWMLAAGWAILRSGWRGRHPGWDNAETGARRAGAMLWSGIGR